MASSRPLHLLVVSITLLMHCSTVLLMPMPRAAPQFGSQQVTPRGQSWFSIHGDIRPIRQYPTSNNLNLGSRSAAIAAPATALGNIGLPQLFSSLFGNVRSDTSAPDPPASAAKRSAGSSSPALDMNSLMSSLTGGNMGSLTSLMSSFTGGGGLAPLMSAFASPPQSKAASSTKSIKPNSDLPYVTVYSANSGGSGKSSDGSKSGSKLASSGSTSSKSSKSNSAPGLDIGSLLSTFSALTSSGGTSGTKSGGAKSNSSPGLDIGSLLSTFSALTSSGETSGTKSSGAKSNSAPGFDIGSLLSTFSAFSPMANSGPKSSKTSSGSKSNGLSIEPFSGKSASEKISLPNLVETSNILDNVIGNSL